MEKRTLVPAEDISRLSHDNFKLIEVYIRSRIDFYACKAMQIMPVTQLVNTNLFDDEIIKIAKQSEDCPNDLKNADEKHLQHLMKILRHLCFREDQPIQNKDYERWLKDNVKTESNHYLSKKLIQHKSEVVKKYIKIKDFKDKVKLDEEIKKIILNDENCPTMIKNFSINRPTAFDILSSCYRYDKNLTAIQKSLMKKIEKMDITDKDSYFECFKETVPNSGVIIKDLQKEAMAQQQQSSNKVNFE